MTSCVDKETLAVLKDIMEDDFKLLIQTFIDDGKTRVPQLKSQFKNNVVDELRRNAHSLKGSASNLGANKLAAACLLVENKAHASEVDGVEALLEQVEVEFSHVVNELSEFL